MSFRRHFYPAICLVYGLGFITSGIIFLCMGEFVLDYAAYFGGIIMIIHGVYTFLRCFVRRAVLHKLGMGNMILTGLINVAGGIVTIFVPVIAQGLVYIFFALYMLFNALLNIIDVYVQGKNRTKGRWVGAVLSFIYFVCALTMVLLPEIGTKGFLIICGCYCIVYGATFVLDFVVQVVPQQATKNHRRRRILSPTVFNFLMPLRKMKEEKLEMYSDEQGLPNEPVTYFPEGKKTDVPPDVEIVIHVSDDGVGKMGHCDVVFEGEILSYGSYDVSTITLFGGLGDGVFFISNRRDYYPFAVRHDHKTLFAYGIRLTHEQKEKVREEINSIKSNLVEWASPLERAMRENPDAKLEDYDDFGSQVWCDTGARFYKFKEGKFKTYFVLTTNCVLLADKIIAPTGMDDVTPNGIMTPGAYYEFLERQLAMKDSMVFCKTIYNKENTADWKAPPPKDGVGDWHRC